MLELKKGQDEMSFMLLQTIISICVSDCAGVRKLPPRMLGKFYSLLSKDESNEAIITMNSGNVVSVEVFIGVQYGMSIPDKCRELQQLIKQEIEVITGYHVQTVKLYVDEIWTV